MPKIKNWEQVVVGKESNKVLFWNEPRRKFLKVEKLVYVHPKSMANKRGEAWRIKFGEKKLCMRKTKQSALKFAYTWMKKHPRG